MMTRFRLKKRPIALGTVAVCITLALVLWWPRDRDRTIRIATATPGGTYYPLGTRLAHILKELPKQSRLAERRIEDAYAWETSGGAENIRLLCNPKPEYKDQPRSRRASHDDAADLAFVQSTALAMTTQDQQEKIRVLARLYTDVVQFVVRRESGIARLADLKGKRVYIGRDHSGTEQIAAALLGAVGIHEADYTRLGANDNYEDASRMLQEGDLDAAIFCSGTPTEAVKRALLEGQSELVDVNLSPEQIRTSNPQFDEVFASKSIPTNFYEGQRNSVQTLGTQVMLAGRSDLDEGIVQMILSALYDNIKPLMFENFAAEDIRYRDVSLVGLAANVKPHRGAVSFWQKEKKKVLIATGSITGRYYGLGRTIQTLLEENGIGARAIHTDGSIENASLLNSPERQTLTIMQYDTALATYLGRAQPVYGVSVDITDRNGDPIRVEGMRRIAAFNEEKVHILIRKAKLPDPTDPKPTVEVLRGQRVCLGARYSGTRILAEAILEHHGVPLDSIQAVMAPAPVMASQLRGGTIDAAFFVAAVPTEALKAALEDDQFRLLSIDPARMGMLLGGAALEISEFLPETYSCQPVGSPAVDTVATRTLLVTTTDIDSVNVGQITRVLFEGAAFLNVEGGEETMAMNIPSLPLHPEAVSYYQHKGFLPRPLTVIENTAEWVETAGQALTILVILVAGYKGVVKLRRDQTANEIGRRIFQAPVSTRDAHSVQRLVIIRSEIDDRVKQRWWAPKELDKSRWRDLQLLINSRISQAKENLTRVLLAEIRAVRAQGDLDSAQRGELLASVEERSWKHLENGELDQSQHDLLSKLVIEGSGEKLSDRST